ncbi:hypothetical protein Tco_1263381 [Tanacetum coccineum]
MNIDARVRYVVSTKSVKGLRIDIGKTYWAGPISRWWTGSCTKPSNEMISCIIKVAKVRPLSGKDPLVIMVAETDNLPHACCGSILSSALKTFRRAAAKFISRLGFDLFSLSVMSNITYIKYVLTQKGLDAFCEQFHIPECVHPQLPSRNQTMHEKPDGKIGVYTRFFDFANFRLPLSTFLVDVLRIEPTVGLFRCFYVNSKNKGWMSFSKRSDSSSVCYTKPIDSLKHWNDHFFWVDSFACPVSFPWHTDKKMDLSAFIHVLDPTKVKVVEREHAEGEPKLLDSTFDEGGGTDQVDSAAGGGPTAVVDPVTDVENLAPDTVIPAKPKRFRKKRPAVADASGSSHPPKKLREDHETSIGAATGGKSSSAIQELLARSILNAEIGVAAVATLHLVTSSVSATPEREGGDPIDFITGTNLRTIGPSERFVISSDSSHHSSTKAADAEVDSVIRSAASPPVMTRAVITTSVLSAPSIPASGATSKVTPQAQPSIFHDSSSAGTIRPYVAGSSHRPRKELSMGSREINSESLHEVFVPRWNMPNDTLLDDHDTSREFIDHLAPLVLFVQIREMDYHHLFTEFNVGTARQACLNTEVRMRTKYCLSERRRLESECEKQVGLLKARDEEIESLKAQLSLKEAEATEVVRLRAQVADVEAAEKVHADELDALKQKNVALEDEKDSLNGKITDLQSSISTKDLELKDFNSTVHALETTCSGLRDQVSGYEHLKEQIEEFEDAQMNVVNDKVAKLEVDLIEMALHLEEKFYPHLLTIICTLTALGTAISCAFEKGMQDGLSAGIDHGREGRSLADVVAYNPSVEEDYNSALRELRAVDFPLLAERKSQKDASVETIMNLLRLEGPLADSPGMSDLQPDVDQLMLPIHRSKDQVVLGATSLSFALSVAHSRVEKIRQNIAEQRSALADVWVPLVDPLSIQNLTGAAGTSDSVPTAAATTTALSNVVISTSSAPSITIDDYEVIGADGQEDAQGNAQRNVAPSPSVEFKKEELDTAP